MLSRPTSGLTQTRTARMGAATSPHVGGTSLLAPWSLRPLQPTTSGTSPLVIAMRTWSWIFVGLGIAATVAHGGELEVAQGAKLLEPFKAELQQALRQGLARGPVEAITACQLRAPEIAKDLSQGSVRLGRTSHRLRNPANVPPSWVSPILEAYLANPSEQTPTTVRLPNDKSGYV